MRDALPGHQRAVPGLVLPARPLLRARICSNVGILLGHADDRLRHYRAASRPAKVEALPEIEIPHVTIIRPVKGLEPDLYKCLAATFHQTYPRTKLTVFFCVSSRTDPSFPVLERLIKDHAAFDARILVEDEDAAAEHLGPNPKIRNMSRAYREAKGDIVWVIDCNVWVAPGVAGRLVDLLCGLNGRPYKFVHQLPIAVDISDIARVLGPEYDHRGGALDELFLSSSHAKFYTAINTVLIAPCVVGKSNMFRRSHLDALTAGQGIDYFSHNICEDHLLGDLLWRKEVPDEQQQAFGKHCMLFGDLAIQPIANMSVGEYVSRRVRWLRVRKFTVALATLVEPATESMLCSAYGAYGITTIPFFKEYLPPTWTSFAAFWLLSITIWCAMDWTLFEVLQGMRSIDADAHTPAWARGPRRRSFGSWLAAWLARETLALPIWTWAVWGGVTVVWRGRRFRVGIDTRVTEIVDARQGRGGGGRPDGRPNGRLAPPVGSANGIPSGSAGSLAGSLGGSRATSASRADAVPVQHRAGSKARVE